jgi:hypothetical protein
MDTIVNPDPANGTTVPNVGIAAARPKPRGKRATLAATVVSAGLTLFGLGLAAGTAQADPDPHWPGECVSNQCPDGGAGGENPRPGVQCYMVPTGPKHTPIRHCTG